MLMNVGKDLAEAIVGLTAELRECRHQRERQFNYATKADLLAVKVEILKAIGERVDPVAVKDLKEASGQLKKAVEANTPKLSGS